jgi:hypothetical protein
MSGEPVDAGQETASAEGSEPDADITISVLRRVQPIVAREDTALARHIRDSQDDGIPLLADHLSYWRIAPDDLVIASTVILFGKAYIETLARRAGDGTIDLLKRIRFRRKNVTGEIHLQVDGGAAATVVVTEDLPDEARLALLDLDVTAPDLRGKYLSWSRGAAAWLPTEALPAKSDEAAP